MRMVAAPARVVAFLALLCLLPFGKIVAGDEARAASACSDGSVYVVAHEDDSILFQAPDVVRDISAGDCVETIIVTAGDAGDTAAYYESRESGTEAAVAEMAGVPDNWTEADAGIAGHPMPLMTLAANPRISLVFMQLPDGNLDGSGFPSDGYQSLQKLWTGAIATITTVDGTSSYTTASLEATIAALLADAHASRVLTQDYVSTFGDGDHSDHHAVALLTQAASQQYSVPHLLNGYIGYGISSFPANLSSADAQAKQAAYFTYAPYDSRVCQTVAACADTYASWWQREYTRGLQFSNLTPTAGAPGTTVTLGGAGFGSATSVSFDGTPAQFAVSSDSTITATVPSGATSGPVTVALPEGEAAGPTQFTVTAPAGPDLALDATATASSASTAMQQLAGKAVDGYTDGCCSGDPAQEWVTVGGGVGSWLDLSWPAPRVLSSLTFYDRPNMQDQVTGGTVTFDDGSTLVVPALPNDGAPLTVIFAPRIVHSLHFVVNAVSATTADVGLAELEARGPTVAPPAVSGVSPASGQPGTIVTISGSGLAWTTSVTFGATPTRFTVAGDDAVTAVVPAHASSAPFTVTTVAGATTTAASFTVSVPPTTPTTTKATTTSSAPTTTVSVPPPATAPPAPTARTTAPEASVATPTTTPTTTTTATPPASPSAPAVRQAATVRQLTGAAPRIDSVRPSRMRVGRVCIVTGHGFGRTILVKIGDRSARFVVLSDSRLKIVAPRRPVWGRVRVRTRSGSATSGREIRVIR